MTAQFEYGAISIDSNILYSLGYKFDSGMLDQLKQFKNKHILIIQPRIIHNEMVKHVSEPFEKLHREIDKLCRESIRKLKTDENNSVQAASQLKGDLDPIALAEKIIFDFYREINGEVLETKDYLDVDELIELYFLNQPPFENNKEKKNEFPDAIALLCLDSWASEKGFKVVAVSNDKGWKLFSEGVANVEVVDDLQSAMAIFQPHQRAMEIIESLLGNDFLDDGKRLFSDIKVRVADYVSDATDLTLDASSSYMFDYDDVQVEFDDVKILQKFGKTDPIDLIRIEDDEITLSISVEVQCTIKADFSFYVEDSMDRDEILIGRSMQATSESFNTLLLVTLSGDFTKSLDEIKLEHVEMQNNIDSVDFGSVEPELEPDYDEKYDYYCPSDIIDGQQTE
ncbi:PIN domain-containing protein [Enterobacter hormaechei]|uniref:PIN domain-containing protein n=1 Tax=Enterobacter hormaechei TaxID=158836 RepID=UPI002B1FE737|nr:PIN domain-containing protein [Enterobacter hormaechei]MEA5190830.1 PIN domain-containing protein [Enterobacter hormaechei]